jgi:hypothetical protein
LEATIVDYGFMGHLGITRFIPIYQWSLVDARAERQQADQNNQAKFEAKAFSS